MRICYIFILFLYLIFMSSCGVEEQTIEKPPLVKTMVAIQKQSEDNDTYSGTVRSRYETNLAFQVGGRILSRNVQVGDSVYAGEVLMTIDSRDIVQLSNQSKSQVAAAKAQLDLAKSNLERYSQLYSEDAIAISVLDQYQTQYDSALAAYQNAVAQAEQSYNELTYTNLIANAAGVISNVNAEEGQVVSAGQTVMTLAQINELEVEINIPENHIQDVLIGKPVKISFWALNDEIDGIIREISPIADSAARTYRVRVSIINPPQGIQLGMTVNATITSNGNKSNDTILLPLSAIYQTDDKPKVWIVEDNILHLSPIIIDEFSGNEVKVRGIKADSVVVTAGVNKLHEGQTVRTN